MPSGRHKLCFADGRCLACDVCASGCPYTSLQIALNEAIDGATIQLCPGTYPTRAVASATEVTDIGAGSDEDGTTLDGERRGRVLTISQSRRFELRDLRVTGGSDPCGGGSYNETSVATLQNIQVTGNQANNGGGIVSHNATTTLLNCRVSHDTAVSRAGHVHLCCGSGYVG